MDDNESRLCNQSGGDTCPDKNGYSHGDCLDKQKLMYILLLVTSVLVNKTVQKKLLGITDFNSRIFLNFCLSQRVLQ